MSRNHPTARPATYECFAPIRAFRYALATPYAFIEPGPSPLSKSCFLFYFACYAILRLGQEKENQKPPIFTGGFATLMFFPIQTLLIRRRTTVSPSKAQPIMAAYVEGSGTGYKLLIRKPPRELIIFGSFVPKKS